MSTPANVCFTFCLRLTTTTSSTTKKKRKTKEFLFTNFVVQFWSMDRLNFPLSINLGSGAITQIKIKIPIEH
jgi:hypothetical protein